MARLIIRKNDILDNYRQFSQVGPVIPVLKANAYGLGAEAVLELLKEEGVTLMAVSRLDEALPLLNRGVEILVLSCHRSEDYADQVLELGFTAALDDLDFATLLSQKAEAMGKKALVHIKIDTGMGRFGFTPNQRFQIKKVCELPGLEVKGIFTHCYTAFSNKEATRAQYTAFNDLCYRLEREGIQISLKHFANSSAAQYGDAFWCDGVRIGSALSGRLPMKSNLVLTPVGRFEGEILAIRTLVKGDNLGYGGVCTLKKTTKVAVVGAGTADGLLRTTEPTLFRAVDILRYLYHDLKLFFKKPAYYGLVNGHRAKMLGRPATTHCFLDVTDIPCKEGDWVTLNVPPLKVDSSVERIYE